MYLKSLLVSGYSFDENEHELKLKYILFNSLLIFNISLVGIATLVRFINTQYTQAFFDFIYVLFALGIFYLARLSKCRFDRLVNYIILLSFLIINLSFYSGLKSLAGLSWYFILLMSVFFLKGFKAGNITFLLSLVLIVGITLKQNQHTLSDIALGIIPFFVGLFFMYFFEQRNNNIKKLLEEVNRTLLKNNLELKKSIKNKRHEILKLTQVLDKSPVSVIMTDINGNIEYANPWFSNLTGYSLEEAIGKNPRILKSDLHSDPYYEKLWKEITANRVWNGTFKNITKGGRIYWESAIIAPVNNEDGELAHFIAIKQEITQQVYLKDKLIQKDEEMSENFEKTLESFVQMVEQRDTYTAGHSHRISEYAVLIAKEMNLSNEEVQLIQRASILHDIGKISTPDSVLLKPGKLTQLEYKLIQEHVTASYEILSRIPMYKDLADIIICHHERYDGKGYPHQLQGSEIPLLSHIMIIADAFDAMTTNRIYKGRKTIPQAIEELKACSGAQFHPEIIKSAIKALSNIQLEETINQLPITDLEKERFSYFYRDRVTHVYNDEYLKFVLNQNKFNKEYACINILYMHNFSKYNTKYGWTQGDILLTQFADYLKDNFSSAQIFRIYGDDFVLINKQHVEIDLEQFKSLEFLKENSITVTARHIDLRENEIIDLGRI